MPTIRYIKSNNERAISKLENDFVKVCALRFPTSTVMLKMFPMIPTHDTEREYNAWLALWFHGIMNVIFMTSIFLMSTIITRK